MKALTQPLEIVFDGIATRENLRDCLCGNIRYSHVMFLFPEHTAQYATGFTLQVGYFVIIIA